MIENHMMHLLEKFLDVTTARHSLVTANMANVDTPGYHAQDIDFRAELRRALQGSESAAAPIARPVTGLIERPDGNNVSLDREGIALAETQIQYRLGIELLQHEFHKTLSAINEGNGQ